MRIIGYINTYIHKPSTLRREGDRYGLHIIKHASYIPIYFIIILHEVSLLVNIDFREDKFVRNESYGPVIMCSNFPVKNHATNHGGYETLQILVSVLKYTSYGPSCFDYATSRTTLLMTFFDCLIAHLGKFTMSFETVSYRAIRRCW